MGEKFPGRNGIHCCVLMLKNIPERIL